MAKPILKWVGGKTQLLEPIRSLLPQKIRNYYEPFIGGASVFLNLASCGVIEGDSYLNDLNPELINLYTIIRDCPEGLKEELDKLVSKGLTQEAYYEIRAACPTGSAEKAARTLYLNKCGFNGLFRMNRKGQFNTPWGKRERVTFFDPANLLSCSQLLQKSVLTTGDFSLLAGGAGPGDVVYVDPPYVPLSATSSFQSYTSDGFGLENQKRLAKWCRELVSRGVHVLASNSDTPTVRELYSDFKIHVAPARRNINSKGTGRGPVNELLMVGCQSQG